MGARNNVRSSKESDANKDIRCFLVTMDKDGQISAENEATSPQRGKTSKDSLSIGKCASNVKPKKNRSVCSASLRQDSRKTKDLHAVSGESKAALSMDKIDIDIQGLDEIQRDGSPPRFIKICDRVLSNRPSFVLLEDASTKNKSKDNLNNSDLSRTESYHAQQQTSPSVVSSRSNVGCQTDEKCSEEDGEPSNNSCCEGNEGKPLF
ncbi:hypothetical protein KR054_004884 [Drosophila jambulina]|nr:hypothetical protein KR054_004884 [Drosophila jambulina]